MLSQTLFIASLILSVSSLIAETQITQDAFASKFFTRFETFGFEVGGTVEIRGKTSNSTGIKVYVCDEDEFRTSLSAAVRASQFCEAKNQKIPFLPLDGALRSFSIPTRGKYYFGIVDCRPSLDAAYQVDLNYVLLSNAEGQQIPLGEIQLPYVESVLAGLWALTLIIQVSYMIEKREFCTPLHGLLCLVIFLRLCVFCITSYFWWTYELTGHKNTLVYNFSYLFFAVAEGAFFLVLYFLSKGWRISRTGIPAADFRATIVAMGILLITMAFFSFYNAEYYFLTLFIMYFFVMPKVFSGITVITSRLEHQIRVWSQLPAPNITEIVSSLIRKKAVLRNVRSCTISYIFTVLVSTAGLRVLVPWWYSWVSTAITECCLWAVTASLCYLVRPVKGVFFNCLTDLLPFVEVQEFAESHNREAGEEVIPWDLSKTIVVEWPREGSAFSLGYVASYYEQEKNGNETV